MFVVQEAGGAL